MSDPSLGEEERQDLVDMLMKARRAVGAAKRAGDEPAERDSRSAVDHAKRGLDKRGPIWWKDGAPDLNRHMVHTTVYAAWFALLT